MKKLSDGDERVIRIVQKKTLEHDADYRLSGFVFVHETERLILLENTFTRQVYALSREEWDHVQRADLSYPYVAELAGMTFLVEDGYDEVERYLLVLEVMKTLEKQKDGIWKYTILPTTACNARCFYCYENDWIPVTMTERTADAVVDFILRTKQEGRIQLDWFGGEPLCAPGIISRICRSLLDRGVEYSSAMITNGTLMTRELTKEAVDLWHLKSVNVSMDGAREDYEKRKRYVRPDLHNYDKAMEAVSFLADAGVRVSVRCNYDEENLPRLNDFFNDCNARFGARDNIDVYEEQLFQSVNGGNGDALYRAAEDSVRYAIGLGLGYFRNISPRLRTHYCMVDGGRTVVIDPEGRIYLCEHLLPDDMHGTIFDKGDFRCPKAQIRLADECRSCPFLPECTPFRKNGCPIQKSKCRTQKELETERALDEMLRCAAGIEA
ncbi:MAG: radical SAM protein [Clostridia bacterium]|nr:radical SAM protein [Clostridia bacterium]